MNAGKTLFAQVMEFVPRTSVTRIVNRYQGNAGVRTLSCAEQFRAMAFAQLTWRESLRDNRGQSVGQRSQALCDGLSLSGLTLHAGRCQRVARLAHLVGPGCIADRRARKLYASESLGVELDNKLDRKIKEMESMRKTLRHLVHCCNGDDRPDCPILDDLGGVLSDASEGARDARS